MVFTLLPFADSEKRVQRVLRVYGAPDPRDMQNSRVDSFLRCGVPAVARETRLRKIAPGSGFAPQFPSHGFEGLRCDMAATLP
jgi:hypothetical protein